jgi:cyclophilin family peptidyl-prolyl cis-trans isomerase
MDALGTGYGGPGYTIPDEIYPDFTTTRQGYLPGTYFGTQFCWQPVLITLAPAPHLDGNYAIFGKVVQGLDVVLAIDKSRGCKRSSCDTCEYRHTEGPGSGDWHHYT